MLYARKLRIILPSGQVCLSLCQFQSSALMFGSMDFVSGLTSSQVYSTIYTCIEKFTKFVSFIPCFKGEGALSTPECANLFFSNTVRLFSAPKMVLRDRDSRFTF